MSKDRQVIAHLSPAELVALMNETGIIAVHESGYSDAKPVIHAALKVVNAKTGEQLPGGLPFSVVMFKGLNEAGYTNIAIGTIVPASDLNVILPRDYFNFCNQRFRFTRVFPVDTSSFVIQMDLVVRDVTRDYVKFNFGLWGALFTQILFELMGRGRESLIAAAEAYGAVHTDFAEHVVTSPAVDELPAAVMPLEQEAIVPAVGEIAATDAAEPQSTAVEDAKLDVADAPVAEAVAGEIDFGPNENVEMVADPAEGKDDEPVAADADALTGAAETSLPEAIEPAIEPVAEPAAELAVEQAAEPAVEPVAAAVAVADPAPEAADTVVDGAAGEAEAKDVMPV